MASSKASPDLQIAQILADLSDLNVAEPDAAKALTNAHKTLKTKPSTPHGQSASPISLRRLLSDSARENNIRLRFMSPSPGNTPPTLSRETSGLPDPYDQNLEPDLARAAALLSLYETRDHFKQQGNKGLARARANVEEVRERYSKI